MIKDNITFKKQVDVVITPQAQKIIASSKYSLEEFKEWALQEQKISLGGHNAVIFLEYCYNKKMEDSSNT